MRRMIVDGRRQAAPVPGGQGAEVADDGGGLHDAAAPDVAAVDHGAGPDDDVVLDDQLVVRQQVQDGVLQDLDA